MTGTQTNPLPSVALARWAGLLYLAIIGLGIWSEMAVRAALIVPGDAAVTAANILGSNGLFHMSLAADIGMVLCDVGVGILLFVLLRPAGVALALSAMVFRLLQAGVLAVNLLFHVAAILLVFRPEYGAAFGQGASEWGALVLLDLQAHGYDLGLVFFAVNCVLTGWLIVRHAGMPNLIGWGLMASGAVYLAGSATTFLAPTSAGMIEPAYLVPFVAELAFALWLLVRGAALSKGLAPASA